jgi:hypothetical protein
MTTPLVELDVTTANEFVAWASLSSATATIKNKDLVLKINTAQRQKPR